MQSSNISFHKRTYTHETRALTALNQDYGVGAPAAAAVAEEEQAGQNVANALQPPRIQPLTAAPAQPITGEKYAGFFPFDVLGQGIANKQG